MLVFLSHESGRQTTKDGFTVVCIDTTLDRMVGYTRPFLRLLFAFALHFHLSPHHSTRCDIYRFTLERVGTVTVGSCNV